MQLAPPYTLEHLLVGCGADELIDLLMRVTLDLGDVIINTPPTFGMYAFDAAVNGAKVVDVRRGDDFSVDVEGIKAAVTEHGEGRCKLTCKLTSA